jgi:hypothetical protein
MNIRIKPMKLTIARDGNTWSKTITVIEDGVVVHDEQGIILHEEHENDVEYFDNWEAMLRQIPAWNIVEVERFI